MRKALHFFSMLMLGLILSLTTSAQEKFETVWERAGDTRPEWMSDGTAEENSWNGTERGIVYNPVTGNVYVASRAEGVPNVRIVDPLTGEDKGELLTMGMGAEEDLDGGGYPLNNVQVSEDGQIFACNMTLASGEPLEDGSIKAFRVYKWEFEQALPEMIIDYDEGGYRLGDKFTVHGDYTKDAVIYAGPGERSIVLQWTITDGILDPEPTVIQVADVLNMGTSVTVEPLGPMPDDDMYISGKGFLPTLVKADGTNVSQFALTTEGAPSRIAGRMHDYAGKTYMAMYQGGAGAQNGVLIDMTMGGENVTDDDIYGMTNTLGEPTAYGEGAVDLATINDSLYMFVCSPDNGIGAYKATDIEVDNTGLADLNNMPGFRLSNYPNPAKGHTTITYALPGYQGMVNLEVFDASGRMIQSYDKLHNQSEVSVELNTSTIPGGVYYYRLRADERTATEKMIVLE